MITQSSAVNAKEKDKMRSLIATLLVAFLAVEMGEL